MVFVSLSFCQVATAQAGSPPAKVASPAVQLGTVEKSVGGLGPIRLTPGFDASFNKTVGLIKKLHDEGSPTDKVDAQDLALTALHFYMDHHRIDLGSDAEARDSKAKKTAADAGLASVLGW